MPFKHTGPVEITVTPLHLAHMSSWNITFQYATVECSRCGPLRGFSHQDEIFSTVSGLTPSEQFLHDHEDYHDPNYPPGNIHLQSELWLPATSQILEDLIARELQILSEGPWYADEPCMMLAHSYVQSFLTSALETVVRSTPRNLYNMIRYYQNRSLDSSTPGS